MKVTSTLGNTLHTAEKIENGQFAFTASENGDYMACFWAPDHSPPITLTVDFDWRTGVHAKDWSNVAKKGQVDVSLLSLRKINKFLLFGYLQRKSKFAIWLRFYVLWRFRINWNSLGIFHVVS